MLFDVRGCFERTLFCSRYRKLTIYMLCFTDLTNVTLYDAQPGPEVIRNFTLNSAAHDIFPAHNC